MKALQAAIVGCGRISDLHTAGYRDRSDAVVAAVCDTDGKLVKEKSRQWDVPRMYTSYKKLLRDDDVDLVELLVPHHLHAEMTIAACEAGKHVSVQKPMALTLAEADAMIEAAEKADVRLRVYENFIFYPPYVKAAELIKEGEIGVPQMIRIHFNTGTRDSAWGISLKAWMWRLDQKRCGGGPLVFDHGYHLFSLAHFFMGAVHKTSAWIDRTQVVPTKCVDGPATVMMKFAAPRSYGVIDIEHTPNMRISSPYYADDNRVEIIGDRGIIMVNRCTVKALDLPDLVLYREGETVPVAVDRVDWIESFVDCTSHLIDVIVKGGEPVLNGVQGKDVLRTALAVQRSAREGREIEVKEIA